MDGVDVDAAGCRSPTASAASDKAKAKSLGYESCRRQVEFDRKWTS